MWHRCSRARGTVCARASECACNVQGFPESYGVRPASSGASLCRGNRPRPHYFRATLVPELLQLTHERTHPRQISSVAMTT